MKNTITSINKVNQTAAREKEGWMHTNRGSLGHLHRSHSNYTYTDVMSYFKDRRGSQRLVQLPIRDKLSEFKVSSNQVDKSHEQQNRGDHGILSPVSSANSDRGGTDKNAIEVGKAQATQFKPTASNNPVKFKGSSRSPSPKGTS